MSGRVGWEEYVESDAEAVTVEEDSVGLNQREKDEGDLFGIRTIEAGLAVEEMCVDSTRGFFNGWFHMLFILLGSFYGVLSSLRCPFRLSSHQLDHGRAQYVKSCPFPR